MPPIPKEVQLQHFVQMYGHLGLQAITAHNKGNDSFILLSDVTEDTTIHSDMKILMIYEKDFSVFDTNLITARFTLNQFRTCKKSHQCVIGIRFPNGDLLTHVIQIVKESEITS